LPENKGRRRRRSTIEEMILKTQENWKKPRRDSSINILTRS